MTSKFIESIIVADANVLLSALAQKAAAKVFDHQIEVICTEHTIGEIETYLLKFSEKYGIDLKKLQSALKLMPVFRCKEKAYKGKIKEAKKLIAERDPDDVDVLALALTRDAPIWTNDNDFKGLGVKIYTTEKLLSALEKDQKI